MLQDDARGVAMRAEEVAAAVILLTTDTASRVLGR